MDVRNHFCLITIITILFSQWIIHVSAQTPPGYTPSASRNLAATFPHGFELYYPGQVLRPVDAFFKPDIRAASLPIFQTYISFMIDLEVNHGGVATSMLHWYQPDLRVSDGDGRLLNLTDRGAHFVGPQPPPGPSHSYVLLLFVQPAAYSFPACFAGIFPISVPTRAGFDILHFMHVAGLDAPVAANYFVAANPDRVSTPIPKITSTSMSSVRCERT